MPFGPGQAEALRLSLALSMLMSPVSHLMRMLINQYTHIHTVAQADATFCQVFEKFFCNLNFFSEGFAREYHGGENLRMMLWRMMSRCRRQKPTHVKVKNNT